MNDGGTPDITGEMQLEKLVETRRTQGVDILARPEAEQISLIVEPLRQYLLKQTARVSHGLPLSSRKNTSWEAAIPSLPTLIGVPPFTSESILRYTAHKEPVTATPSPLLRDYSLNLIAKEYDPSTGNIKKRYSPLYTIAFNEKGFMKSIEINLKTLKNYLGDNVESLPDFLQQLLTGTMPIDLELEVKKKEVEERFKNLNIDTNTPKGFLISDLDTKPHAQIYFIAGPSHSGSTGSGALEPIWWEYPASSDNRIQILKDLIAPIP